MAQHNAVLLARPFAPLETGKWESPSHAQVPLRQNNRSRHLQPVALDHQEGLTKFGLGREEFEKRIWDWKHRYGATITSQMVKIGDSCDWSRALHDGSRPLARGSGDLCPIV